jgi:hypothetical protein
VQLLRTAEVDDALGVAELAGDGVGGDVQGLSNLVGCEVFGEGRVWHSLTAYAAKAGLWGSSGGGKYSNWHLDDVSFSLSLWSGWKSPESNRS